MIESRGTDAEIYGRHAEELVRFATGLVGPADAQDVVSSAVLRALAARSWRSVENHRAFLYRSVLNEARNHHRATRRRRDREVRSLVILPTTAAAPDHSEVAEALCSLSPRQRAVVVLTYWDSLTPDEVARDLGIRPGSVRRHLARARARLRELLADDERA